MKFHIKTQINSIKVGLYVLGLAVFIFQGCFSDGSYTNSGPKTRTTYGHTGGFAENDYCSLVIKPTSRYGLSFGPEAFIISVQNKTDSTLEIDWNRTLFLDNGQSRGTFMFEGIKYADRNSQKAPDIIGPNSSFKKSIWPNGLVSPPSRYGSWSHNSILGYDVDTGTYGVSLAVKVDGKEIRQSVELTITRSETYE